MGALGLNPSPSRANVIHTRFAGRDPDGHLVTVSSARVVDDV
jgi:hypothetical protein